jgi:hypothetical protein
MRILIIIFALSGCTTPMGKLALDTGYEGTAGGLIDAGVDVDVDGGPAEAEPGDDCTGGGVLDCDLECWVADARAYMGDGTCDAGQRGPDFDCELTGFDAGDCSTGSDLDAGPDPTDGGSDVDESGTDADDGSDDGAVDDGSSADDGAVDDGAADDGVSPDEGDPEPDADADGDAATDPGTDDDGGVGAPSDDEPDSGVGSACIADREWLVAESYVGSLFTTVGSPGFLDCSGECVPEELYSSEYAWLGDGFCDDGTPYSPSYEAADFDCEAWAYDNGDCTDGMDSGSGGSGGSGGDSGGGSSTGCGAASSALVGEACEVVYEGEHLGDGFYDCSGSCKWGVPSDYADDSICDDGVATFVDMYCDELSCDGADCIELAF